MYAADNLKVPIKSMSMAGSFATVPAGAGNALSLMDNRPSVIQRKKANKTGLPDKLKSGIENLSGHSMDDVKVHYNSAEPAQLNAHAYAQGTDIHIAAGQERHLAHEAWHVVQQKQGRVKPTAQMKGKVNVNNDKGLEKEADMMGAKAGMLQLKFSGLDAKKQAFFNRNIVQLVLSDEERGRLQKWCMQEQMKLAADQFEKIIAAADNFEKAKEMALDLSAAAHSKIRATIKINANKSGKTGDELEILADVVENLRKGGLGPALPAAIASLAELLMDAYPPDTHSYVMMGNSPAPLLAWMQLNGRHAAAFHLPLGGLTAPNGDQEMRRMEEVAPGSVQAKVSSYLTIALEPAVARRLPLVLIDYVSTGGSLVAAARFIKTWLLQRRIDLSVFIFGYSEKSPQVLEEFMRAGHAGILATSIGKLENVFTKMNADKLYKNALLLKGPASVDIENLLKEENPANAVVQHPDHWARVINLMKAELHL